MMHISHCFPPAVLVLAASACVLADEPAGAPASADRGGDWALTVYWENDAPFFKPNNDTDRQYTNGTGVGIAHQPDWADALAPHVPFADDFGPARTGAGYLIGQLIFTPDDLNERNAIEDDRPYSGYLFGAVYWQRANASTLDHIQLELGVVGPASQADHAQVAVHEMFADVQPRGWSHQLADEVTFQSYVRKKWRLPGGPESMAGSGWAAQLIPQLGIALGTVHRHVEAGAVFRVGAGLPDDFGPGRLADVGAATARSAASHAGIYGFIRASGRVVEHDLSLEGNTFRGSQGVDPEPLVGELQLGAAVHVGTASWRLELTYGQTFISDQFKTQDGTHAFGAWTLGFRCIF